MNNIISLQNVNQGGVVYNHSFVNKIKLNTKISGVVL